MKFGEIEVLEEIDSMKYKRIWRICHDKLFLNGSIGQTA